MDEFVIGFMSEEPDGLTPIDIVMDVTGLTYDEIKSCCKVITIPESEPSQPEKNEKQSQWCKLGVGNCAATKRGQPREKALRPKVIEGGGIVANVSSVYGVKWANTNYLQNTEQQKEN